MPSQSSLLKPPDWFRVDGKSIRIREPSFFSDGRPGKYTSCEWDYGLPFMEAAGGKSLTVALVSSP